MRLKIASVSIPIVLCAVACSTPPPAPAESSAPLLEGRTIPVEVRSGSGLRVIDVRVDEEGGTYETLYGYVRAECDRTADARDLELVVGEADECAADARNDVAVDLCVGYRFLEMSDSLAPTDILSDASKIPFVVRRPAGEEAELPDGWTREMTVPVLTGHGAATAALLAVQHFQDAAIVGADALRTCDGSGFHATLATEDDEVVTVGFVLASQTIEASEMMHDAAASATRLIEAAADQRLARSHDPRRSRVESWRGAIDSRLEVANLWVGAPATRFNPVPGAVGDALVSPADLFPAIDWAPTRDSERQAVALLRDLRVDPRSDASSASIEERVMTALRHDRPQFFEGESAMRDLDDLGFDADELRLAARYLTQEADALGRPIAPDGVPMSGDTQRVRGTELRASVSDPIRIAALTAGSVIANDGDTEVPSLAYAHRGVIQTTDYVYDGLAAAASNLALTDRTREIIATALAEHDALVSMRAQVCATAASAGSTGSLRLRLYGVPDVTGRTAAQWGQLYELWWGEAGRTCATESTASCGSHLIAATPTLRRETVASGRRTMSLEWSISGETAGIPATPIPGDGTIYVTARDAVGTGRRGVIGFVTSPGTAVGSFSRCTMLPAGPEAFAQATKSLTASAIDAARPADHCSGVRDVPLPLEDNFAEAGTSDGYMEAAFVHYLDRAESAAQRAEALGSQLIAQQAEMDAMADQAVQHLNQICGTTVSAGAIEVRPPGLCSSSSECPTGQRCESGRCVGSLGLDAVSGTPEDLARLERCLAADPRGMVPASLGDQALCAWYQDGNLCACDGESCPRACPVRSPDQTGCSSAWPAETPPPSAPFVTRPLSLVSVEVPGGTASPSACLDLARLRRGITNGEDADALVDRVTNALWLNQATFQQVAQALAMHEGVGGFAEVTRGGRPFLSNGDMFVDPELVSPSACGEDLRISPEDREALCSGEPTDHPIGRSIRCGWSWHGCSMDADRVGVAHRLRSALHALMNLAGEGIQVSGLEQSADAGWVSTTSVPLPTWVGADGQLVWRERGDAGARVTGQCVDLLTDLPILRLRSLWPSCDDYTSVVVSEADTVDTTYAVRLWQPTRRYFPASPGRPVREYPVQALIYLAGTGGITSPFTRVIRDTRSSLPADSYMLAATVFDALELACMAVEDDVGGCPAEWEELPTIESADDLDRVAQSVRCAGDRFDRIAERTIIPELPAQVADDIAYGRITGTFPAYAGEYGQQVAVLRGEMENLVSAARTVASTLRDVAGDLRIAQSEERTISLSRQIESARLASEMSAHLNRCAAALMPQSAGTSGVTWNPGSVFVCLDAVTQIGIAYRMRDLRNGELTEEQIQARTRAAMQFASRIDTISNATGRLSSSYAAIQASLAVMDRLRSEGRAQLGRIAFRDRDDVGQEWRMGRSTRGRHNRTRIQYEQAHASAVRLAYLARRAIEERVGMNLSDITNDLPQVAAPSTWADEVCTTTGVDYYELWPGAEDAVPHGVLTVADYVARLRDFTDSYQLAFPFENGRDTVVVSLRDDVFPATRTDCRVESPNLLRGSDRLDPTGALWSRECDGESICPTVTRWADRSVFVTRSTEPVSAGTDQPIASRGTRPLGGGAEHRFYLACDTVDCGGSGGLGGGWAQTIEVPVGESYVLSWYERVREPGDESSPIPTSPRLAPRVMSTVLGAGATVYPAVYLDPGDDRWIDADHFRRAYALVTTSGELSGAATYRVGVGLASLPDVVDAHREVGFGAIQLEQLAEPTSEPEVGVYYPTDRDGLAPIGRCATTQTEFATAFRFVCDAAICPDGIGRACVADEDFDPALRTCYWETDFDVSLRDIERGVMIPNGGFAVGNFNYRVDSLAVNLVGQAIRDCSSVGSGVDGCYASGFIPFSIHHEPGATIRNHLGEEYRMSIFPGEIVSAKALAAERVITNPISGADRGLLADYWRTEFRGRPVNGSYRLRIHAVPGLDLSRVEDVQIVLNYRYWTRQE